jgi:hypothetical protein
MGAQPAPDEDQREDRADEVRLKVDDLDEMEGIAMPRGCTNYTSAFRGQLSSGRNYE